MGLEFRVLGPLQVLRGDELVPVDSPKQRALLALLLVHAGQVLSTDRILEEIWGDDPPGGGARTLQVHVSNLRKMLEPDRGQGQPAEVVVTESGGYSLRVAPEGIDATRFERSLDQARQLMPSHPEQVSATLREALAMWRGRPYEDFAYESFAQGEIRRLEELRLLAIEDRFEADLNLGHHAESVGELQALTEEFPFRERIWGLLMLALYRSDRQGDALRAYQTARKMLGEELGIEPSPELRRLEEEILFQSPSLQLAREPVATPHNLPERVSSFLGRSQQIAQVVAMLSTVREVTLTGPGGVGKTSLAIEIARTLLASHRDGVWLVDLAAVQEPGLTAQTVADVVGVSEPQQARLLPALLDHLKARQVLLILDNCEHLVEESAGLTDTLLEGASGVTVLATSRESLQTHGETIWPVPPLPVPSVGRSAPWAAEEALGFDAVRLFEARARAASSDFVLVDANAQAVVEICQSLDGIPLALELAAAQTTILSAIQISDRLTGRLSFLAGGQRTRPERHRTLRATIEWSYDLLAPSEQQLFDRLSVFEGDFSLTAAEAVGGGEQVIDLLKRLVDTSMVATVAGEGAQAETRFRLLETLREYGQGRLDKRGETDLVRARHTSFYRELVEEAEQALRTPPRGGWLDRLALEYANIRSALDWSLDHEELALSARFAGGLGWLWFLRLRSAEGWRWLQSMLADGESASPATRMTILLPAAFCAWGVGDYQAGKALSEEAIEVTRSLGNREGLADALFARGRLALAEGDSSAPKYFTESIAVAEEAGDQWRRAIALLLLTPATPEARATFEECLAVFRATEDVYSEAVALSFLGRIALADGDLVEARDLTVRTLNLLAQTGDRKEMPYGLYQLCVISRLQSELTTAAAFGSRALDLSIEYEAPLLASKALMHLAAAASNGGLSRDAARLFGAIDAIREELGAPLITPWESAIGIGNVITATKDALGPEPFNNATKEGTALSFVEATRLGYEVANMLGTLGAEP